MEQNEDAGALEPEETVTNGREEDAGPPPGMHRFRKGVYIVPSLVTSMAFFCGFYAIVASINGDFYRAAWAVILAMVFDGLDGRIARAIGATSDFGVQLDSLSDLMAFGLAPAILMYNWVLQPYGRAGWMAAFLFALCGALRLARFNIQQSTGSKNHFTGLPIPMAAGVLATTVLLTRGALEMEKAPEIAILIMVYVLALLMVSSVPYRNFKYIDTKKRRSFHPFFGILSVFFIAALAPHHVLFALAVTYTLHGPVEAALAWRKGVPHPPVSTGGETHPPENG